MLLRRVATLPCFAQIRCSAERFGLMTAFNSIHCKLHEVGPTSAAKQEVQLAAVSTTEVTKRDFPICPGHIAQRAETAVRMGRDDPGHYSMSERDENYDGIVVSAWHARDNCAEELITPLRKSSIAVLSPRLEIKTASRMAL